MNCQKRITFVGKKLTKILFMVVLSMESLQDITRFRGPVVYERQVVPRANQFFGLADEVLPDFIVPFVAPATQLTFLMFFEGYV